MPPLTRSMTEVVVVRKPDMSTKDGANIDATNMRLTKRPDLFLSLFRIGCQCFSLFALQATGMMCFLIGFVTVLCVGNFFRARRAMDRQKQRRLARLSENKGNGVVGIESPGSDFSSPGASYNGEQQSLLSGGQNGTRRRPVEENTNSLLLDVNGTGPRAQITSI